MLRKGLILTALLMGIAASGSREVSASSCYGECYQSWGECCGYASYCEPYYQDCVASCDRGVGPWLIC